MNVTFDAEFGEVADLFEEIGAQIYPQVERSALNEAATQQRTQIRRLIRAGTGVPAKVINKRMKLHRANARRSSAKIFMGTMPVSAYKDLGARELKRGGVSYRGPGGRVREPRAFVAHLRYGRNAFRRSGPARKDIKQVTVPIERQTRIAIDTAKRSFPDTYQRLFASKFQYRFNQAVAKRRGIRLI